MTTKLRNISLGLLREEVRLQVRSSRVIKPGQRGITERSLEDSVEKFKLILEAGSPLDPISVFESEGVYYIVDGHHRYRAYLEHYGYSVFNEPPPTAPEVPVVIHEGDLLYHLRQSYTVNTKHGVGLEKEERTQRLLFSLVHTPVSEWSSIKQMAQEVALSLSQIDKIRKAARTLIREAGIKASYDPDSIQSAVIIWVTNETKKLKDFQTVDGRNRVPTDDQGYPTVSYINDRKIARQVDDDTLAQNDLMNHLSSYAQMNPKVLRTVIKRLNKEYTLGITVKSSWSPPQDSEDYDDEDSDF